jgi:glycosyltransferase involved in cell wall biosynthesis
MVFMNKKKFSVVIPALNEEKLIDKAITSLQKQSIDRNLFEIIVVDNGSTDNTFSLAQKAGADKVVIETKMGTNIARQRGVLESMGEIVAFLDADSEAPSDWLSRIESYLSSDVVMISGPYDYNFSGITKFFDYIYTGIIIPVLPSVLYGIFRKKAGVIIEGNFAVWREAINKIGGLPPLVFYGDGAATAMLISRHVGKVKFEPTLKVKTDSRRFQNGTLKQVLKYASAYLKMYFSKEYL